MRIIAATVVRVLHPVGPLPASVYWRRRAVAFAGLVVVLLLLWAVLPDGGDDTPRDSAAAVGSPSPTEPAAAATSTGSGGLTASPASDDPGRAGDGPAPTATSAAATTAPATPKPTPPPAPKPCPDSALRLTVAPAQPAYVVGQAPVLRLQVRNVGTLSCTRDLGAALQEVLLYQGTQRLWSSNDCYPEGERDQELMRPGVVYTFSVTWSGLVSRPKCAGTRTRVGAGAYTLVARLGSLVSPRAPLTLRPA
jgi:hypothetical protein